MTGTAAVSWKRFAFHSRKIMKNRQTLDQNNTSNDRKPEHHWTSTKLWPFLAIRLLVKSCDILWISYDFLMTLWYLIISCLPPAEVPKRGPAHCANSKKLTAPLPSCTQVRTCTWYLRHSQTYGHEPWLDAQNGSKWEMKEVSGS